MGKIALAVMVSLWVVPTTVMVNRIVPEPYMMTEIHDLLDEIFHTPQAQQYCKGNFGSWNPMITTPLFSLWYYLSLAHVASLFPGFYCLEAASFSDLCSTAILRSINSVLAVVCSVILYDIVTHLKPTINDMKAMLHVVVLSLYPLHWFFNFLYYTDVASVTAVLATYLASLKKHYRFSALVSVAHPYLLADNRHYPFYLWRKVIMARWSIIYLLVPIYICSWLSIIHMLGKFRSKMCVLAYFLATASVLVPAPLIEFRYYAIPFYFLVLHCNNRDAQSWILTGILYIGVNIFTMMMFLFRPFHWDHEPGIQRFIW